MNSKLVTVNSLVDIVKEQKKKQHNIILAGGFFDFFHPGHLDYLREAKLLNGVVIVGVNSDQSFTKVKGKPPLFTFMDRVSILSALEYVDYVVKIDEFNLADMIEKIKPNYFVKGIDYKGKLIPEHRTAHIVGTKVLCLGKRKRFSSTELKNTLKY